MDYGGKWNELLAAYGDYAVNSRMPLFAVSFGRWYSSRLNARVFVLDLHSNINKPIAVEPRFVRSMDGFVYSQTSTSV